MRKFLGFQKIAGLCFWVCVMSLSAENLAFSQTLGSPPPLAALLDEYNAILYQTFEPTAKDYQDAFEVLGKAQSVWTPLTSDQRRSEALNIDSEIAYLNFYFHQNIAAARASLSKAMSDFPQKPLILKDETHEALGFEIPDLENLSVSILKAYTGFRLFDSLLQYSQGTSEAPLFAVAKTWGLLIYAVKKEIPLEFSLKDLVILQHLQQALFLAYIEVRKNPSISEKVGKYSDQDIILFYKNLIRPLLVENRFAEDSLILADAILNKSSPESELRLLERVRAIRQAKLNILPGAIDSLPFQAA